MCRPGPGNTAAAARKHATASRCLMKRDIAHMPCPGMVDAINDVLVRELIGTKGDPLRSGTDRGVDN